MLSIRGAITANNSRSDIMQQGAQLVDTILKRNNIDRDKVVAIIFSVTKDLDTGNPSTGVRQLLDWEDVSLFTTQEMFVVGSLEHCIRVLVLANVNISSVQHVYLGGASCLRPDRQ